MWTSFETTHPWKVACPNDGRKLQKRRLCPHDWRQPRSEDPMKREDLCAGRVWIKNLPPRTTKNVSLLERILGNLHGISWVCTLFVGSNKTNNCSGGQKISHTIFADKSYSTIFVERMWLCAAVQLQNNTYRWFSKHSSWVSQLDLKVTEKNRLKIREDVQTTPIEVTTSSSDVADEEHFFFARADGEDATEEQTLENKEQSRKKATEWGHMRNHLQWSQV